MQPRKIGAAQEALSLIHAKAARCFLAGVLALKKIRKFHRLFLLKEISDLKSIQRNLSPIDVNQTWNPREIGRLKESAKNIVGDFVVKNDATVPECIAPRLVVSEPIRPAQSLTSRVAKLRCKRAYFVGDFIRLHHLIEIGIDPTVLPSHK